MSKILAFVDHFLPGFKAGGPVRTLANIVDRLGDEFEFRIVTRDRDWTDTAPYPDVRADAWQRVGKAEVFYASAVSLRWGALRRLLTETDHGAVYVNSLFSPTFTLPVVTLRALHLVPWRPLIVAPRGELSEGALAIRGCKKRVYRALARVAGLYSDAIWQASSDYEAADILRHFAGRGGGPAGVLVAPDLAAANDEPLTPRRAPKRPGTLRAVFLSRITPKKNLDGALRMLASLEERVEVDIYGPLEDTAYWSACRRLIASLPANVSAAYRGLVDYPDVLRTMAAYDLFLLPSRGENFGHVILEALSAGCPVLISDQTAFRGLAAAGVGWDVPLDRPDAFATRLRQVAAMDDPEHAAMRRAAQEYAAGLRADPVAVAQNRALFDRAVATH